MINNKKLIAFTGFARSGKGCFCSAAEDKIDFFYPNLKVEQFSFAKELRLELESFLLEKLGISAFTEDPEEKELIRPYLLAHGNARRKTSNNQYWIKKLEQQIFHSDCDVAVITDLRFAETENDELGWFKKNGGKLYHLKRYVSDIDSQQASFDPAPNDYEKENNPKLEESADAVIILERFEKEVDFLEECDRIVEDIIVREYGYFNK